MLAVYLENGRIEVRDEPRPHRPEGMALIRLLCGGICNTDLELQRGYYGFAGPPGHEFVGEVIEPPRSPGARRRTAPAAGRAARGWCPGIRRAAPAGTGRVRPRRP